VAGELLRLSRRDDPTDLEPYQQAPPWLLESCLPRGPCPVGLPQIAVVRIEWRSLRPSQRARSQLLEGDWTPTRLVVLEFPTAGHATRWHDSDEYKPLKELRHTAADVDLVLVQGIET
jgi:hypothetical protein